SFVKNTNPKSCGNRLALLALCWGICCIFTNSASSANGVAPVIVPTGGFAIEGNLLANTPTNGVGDWIAITNFPGTGGGVLDTNGTPLDSTTTFHQVDPFNSSSDTIISGGNANTDPNGWTWGTGSVAS